MKKIVLVSLLFISAISFAQFPIVKDTVRKAGIYKSFEEFRDNKPSIKLENKIVSKPFRYGSYGNDTMSCFALDIDKQISKKMGDVFGFCDGICVYLIASEGESKVHKYNFCKVEYIGKLCYYYTLSSASFNAALTASGFQYPTASTNQRSVVVIDLSTGSINLLSKRYLKEILSQKPELLQKFNALKSSDQNLKQFLIEYLHN